jgi:hypothetical protein
VITCHCGKRIGFTCVQGWWVCRKCKLPTELYLTAMTEKGFSMGLVYFEGGPLDGQAYESKSLLGGQGLMPEVGQYNWTPDKKTSSSTGAVAQIWRWKHAEGGAATPTPSTADEGEVVAAIQSANGIEPMASPPQPDAITTEVAPAGTVPAAASNGNGRVPETASTAARPRAQTRAPTATGPIPDGQDGPTLRRRREALSPKVNRVAFAEMLGFSAARVDRVERELGKGKPMLEERTAMASKLDELEQKGAVTTGAHV